MNSELKLTVIGLVVIFLITNKSILINATDATQGITGIKRSSPAQSVSASSTSSGTVVQLPFKKTRNTTLLQPLVNGKTYNLGYLFDLINTNNPRKTSNFIIISGGNTPASKTASSVGLSLSILNNSHFRDLQVTVKQDDTGIIQNMQKKGILPIESDLEKAKTFGWYDIFSKTAKLFPQILMCFSLPPLTTLPQEVQNIIPQMLKDNWGIKFYLIDPWSQSTPIKWNKLYTPEQVCRPYRLLMDWNIN